MFRKTDISMRITSRISISLAYVFLSVVGLNAQAEEYRFDRGYAIGMEPALVYLSQQIKFISGHGPEKAVEAWYYEALMREQVARATNQALSVAALIGTANRTDDDAIFSFQKHLSGVQDGVLVRIPLLHMELVPSENPILATGTIMRRQNQAWTYLTTHLSRLEQRISEPNLFLDGAIQGLKVSMAVIERPIEPLESLSPEALEAQVQQLYFNRILLASRLIEVHKQNRQFIEDPEFRVQLDNLVHRIKHATLIGKADPRRADHIISNTAAIVLEDMKNVTLYLPSCHALFN